MFKLSKRMLFGFLSLACAFLGCIAIGILFVQRTRETPSSIKGSTEVEAGGSSSEKIVVDARQVWTSTSVTVDKQDRLEIRAEGEVNVASPSNGADKWVGPDGWGYIPLLYCNGQPCKYKFRTADSLGCLIGRIGNGKPFKVGSNYSTTVTNGGTLYLGVNDAVSDYDGRVLDDSNAAALMFSDNRGSFTVLVRVTGRQSKDEPQAKAIAEGTIPVNQPWTFAGRFKGRVIVQVEGQAVLNPASGLVGPEGEGVPAPDSFTLPRESSFCVLAKFDGRIEKIGAYRELFFASETDLLLGPNDEITHKNGNGFSDNRGAWSYKVLRGN